MQLYDIEYFLAIASARNLNHAAKVLFISPSALSMFLTKLEKRLGVQLFIRGKDSLQLTAAGEIYHKAALEISKIKNNAMSQIEALSAPGNVTIRFALIGGRATRFASVFLPVLQQRLPNTAFLFNQESISWAYSHIADGSADFAIGTLDYAKQKDYHYIPLCREEIGLLFPEGHRVDRLLREMGLGHDDPADISVCRDETLVLCERGTVITRTCSRYFKSEHFTPARTIHSAMRSIGKITCLNQAVGLCPRGYFHEGEGLVFQRMKNPIYYDLGIILQQDRPLSADENSILSILKELKDRY